MARRLCTICARGGSKGVPNKNVRPLFGRPLIAWTIDQARASGLFALVAVSSDSAAILDAAGAAGADLLIERPLELASDHAAKVPAIHHAFRTAEARTGLRFDTFVDLDCTSPLRLPADIAGAVAMVESGEAGNVLSVAPARHSPYFNQLEAAADGTVQVAKKLDKPVLRRQDAPACYDVNASVYVWQREPFMSEPYLFDRRTRLYVMPAERSVDIDSELDFAFVEFLMGRTLRAAAE
jgi:N-acylneuraminate cytidylyltransferase/CMP-N,N'-diacetyllegionaminic acid synthase